VKSNHDQLGRLAALLKGAVAVTGAVGPETFGQAARASARILSTIGVQTR
jgi:hypothetical protein